MAGPASLSLDLDNQWSYLKNYGVGSWQSFPSYLDCLVPRVVEFFDRLDVKITVFVVGQDAALEKNHAALRSIAEAGHEIANHSFGHEQWLEHYTQEELDREFAMADEAIERATGQRPVGFRGPGFSMSKQVLQTLARRGYRYDATVFPNLLDPVIRLFFFALTKLPAEEKRKRHFGTLADAFRPMRPFRWALGAESLIEVPVTTLPLFRVPMHFSYLIYLASYSWAAARAYFAASIRLCRLTGVQPSLLLHPPEFLDGNDVAELAFYPGMKVPVGDKLAFLEWAIRYVERDFRMVTVEQHARDAEVSRDVPSLRFKTAG